MNAEELRELQDRGKFFYETFPGAAAAEEYRRARDQAEQEYARTLTPKDDADDVRSERSSTGSACQTAQ
jgi:hypothetical protein